MKKLLVIVIVLSLVAPLFFGCDRIENKDAPVKLKWRYKTGFYQADLKFYERFHSIPSVVDGVVYDGLTNVCLYAIDKNTGELKWKFCDKQAVFSFPSVADGMVYVGKWSSSYSNNKSYIYAINASSGKLMWRTKLSVAIDWYGSPTVSDGIVYIGSADRIGIGTGEIQYHLCAIDAVSGEILWRYEVEGGIVDNFSPIAVDDTVYFGGMDYYLYAVDAKSGELKWQSRTEDLIPHFPSVVDGIVYAGTADGFFFAVDASNGELKWKFETGHYYAITSPVVVNGVAYAGSYDGYFYAIDADTGWLKWQFKTEGIVTSPSPFVINDSVYFGSRDSYLYALNINNGVLKWKYKTKDRIVSSITIVDGIIYFKCRDGYFYALEMKKDYQ